MIKKIICFTSMLLLCGNLYAAELNVAVASNFKHTLSELADDFKVKTGHELKISSASSGKLFSQLMHGAPYDVFMSADEKFVDLLIAKEMSSADSATIYALGKLVLISNIAAGNVNKPDCDKVLSSPHLNRLAIANPRIAPYGLAARQVLDKLALWQTLQTRIVMGENVQQVFQFVSTKNADAAFVAESIYKLARSRAGDEAPQFCVWDIPNDFYTPIRQKMTVLNNAKNKNLAHAFVKFIKSAHAREVILNAGYDVLLNDKTTRY